MKEGEKECDVVALNRNVTKIRCPIYPPRKIIIEGVDQWGKKIREWDLKTTRKGGMSLY